MLVKCPECGKKMSSTAAACPKCGAQISSEQMRKAVSAVEFGQAAVGFVFWLGAGLVWFRSGNWVAGLLFWGMLVLVAGLFVYAYRSTRPKQSRDQGDVLALEAQPALLVHSERPADPAAPSTLSSILARSLAGEALNESDGRMVLPILQRARGFRPALNSRERTFLQQLESSVDRALAAGIALTPLQSDIRDARSVRRRKYAVAGFAIVAVLAIVALTVVDYGADQSPTAGRVEAEAGSVAQKEAGADGRAIEVGGKSIRVGDTADEVFEKLQPRTSHRRISEPDPRRPGSLIVRHVYALEGQDWEFTFARQADPGPYRLVSIASAPEAESSGIPYADPTAAAAIDRSSMDPRQHYQVTVLGFDAVSGYDGGTTDFLRLKITNGSQVTLPTLTVRTNRWSQGTNVGWSRAPPIDVSDLKPGYSKTVDYYPRGHLGAFALDGLTIDSMTVEIEETIASDSRRFFPELETAEMAQREAEQARRAEEAREIVNTALAEQSHEARKEAAWNAFYVPSKVCENPPDMDTQVECGNAHIRAKKDFEKKWSRGLIK